MNMQRLIQVSAEAKKKAADAKSRGDEAFKRNEFDTAVDAYTQVLFGYLPFLFFQHYWAAYAILFKRLFTLDLYLQAIDLDPTDGALFSNRSLCWLRLGQAEQALSDAKTCRALRPDWPKACYREGAALRLLQACPRVSLFLFLVFSIMTSATV